MQSKAQLLTVSLFASVLGLAGEASAQARTFMVDGNGGSHMQFVSDATLERITGVSSKLSGNINVDPTNLSTGKGEVACDIASIKTGIDLRDEHLRKDNWLDAAKYPHAQFVITKVSGASKLKPNEATDVTVTGKFSLHGVTKEISPKARVRWVPASAETAANKVSGDVLRVQTSFTVHLEDYNVAIPSIVSLKVSPDIQVNVDLRATGEAPPTATATAPAAPAAKPELAAADPAKPGKAPKGAHPAASPATPATPAVPAKPKLAAAASGKAPKAAAHATPAQSGRPAKPAKPAAEKPPAGK